MKKKILSIAIATLMAGCSSEDVANQVPDKNELNVKAKIDVALNSKAGQGIIDGAAFGDNTEIAVIATGEGYLNCQQGKFNFANSLWNRVGEKVMLTTSFADIYAYYPADAKLSPAIPQNDDNNGIEVNESSMDGNVSSLIRTDDTDYMYALTVYGSGQTRANNQYNQVEFNFRHLLSKMTFIIKKDATYADVGVLSAIKFEDSADKFPDEPLVFLLRDGSYKTPTKTKVTKLFKPTNPITITPNETGEMTAQFLVFPRTKNPVSTEPTMLRLTMDGKDMEVTLLNTENSLPSPQSNWKSGQHYVFNLLVKPRGLILQEVTIAPWEDVEVGGGEAI